MGPLEETSMDEIKAQYETNFFEAIRVMQAIIPIMKKQRNGRIVNVTSMGGRIAIPLDSIYHGTTFGLEGVSKSLQYEFEPFGISIISVEPGAVQSSLWKNVKIASRSSTNPNSPYQPLTSTMSKAYIQMEQNAMHPSEVTKVILIAVTSDNPQLRYAIEKEANKMLEIRKTMSDVEFQNLIKKQSWCAISTYGNSR